MYYKHSICHPENSEIEYPDKKLSAEQVREIARNYPWKQELQKLKTLPPDEINYSPSVDFTNLQDHHSLCLTAEGEPDDFRFSVFYNRPVKRKVLFGLLGEKVVMDVIDKPFKVQGAFRLLELFLKQEYGSIEKAYAFGE
ncbi:MAG: hypothetical protein L6Q97_07820 [Thermoanaerobaculia bacterium]|nr:hypothetical protein [Thermoanaerobaculia bacterium]